MKMITGDPVYTGSPVRLALRYDLEYRNRFALASGWRKTPGSLILWLLIQR